MLNTGHPMYVWWGPELACLYNDAYRDSIGPERHPGSLGRPAREVWAEIWPIIGPQIEQVMSGRGATWNVDQLVPITRHGRLEDVYWTYSYSPIDDETAPGGIGGVLVVCTETTQAGAGRAPADDRARPAGAAVRAGADLHGAARRAEAPHPRSPTRPTCSSSGIGRCSARPWPKRCPKRPRRAMSACSTASSRAARRTRASGARYEVQPTPGRRRSPSASSTSSTSRSRTRTTASPASSSSAPTSPNAALAFASMRESEARFRDGLEGRPDGLLGNRPRDADADLVAARAWRCSASTFADGRGRYGGPDDEYARRASPRRPSPRAAVPRARRAAGLVRRPTTASCGRTARRCGCPAAAR